VRHLINNNKKEKKMGITNKDLELIKDLVDDLGWEHQRMSSSGQESYEKLCKVLGWEFEG
jgi:predicted glycosyltransferase